jgi:hypothetical protein
VREKYCVVVPIVVAASADGTVPGRIVMTKPQSERMLEIRLSKLRSGM